MDELAKRDLCETEEDRVNRVVALINDTLEVLKSDKEEDNERNKDSIELAFKNPFGFLTAVARESFVFEVMSLDGQYSPQSIYMIVSNVDEILLNKRMSDILYLPGVHLELMPNREGIMAAYRERYGEPGQFAMEHQMLLRSMTKLAEYIQAQRHMAEMAAAEQGQGRVQVFNPDRGIKN